MTQWYDGAKRDLPWRRTRDPYRILVSEIMLQQTRAQAVIPYYERFLESFPTAQELARASEIEVLRRWSGLGYYARARNLQKAARQRVPHPSQAQHSNMHFVPLYRRYSPAYLARHKFG